MQTQPRSFDPLPTIGMIADRFRVRTHQVTYAVRTLGLRASSRAGRMRVFNAEEVARIETELRRNGAIAAAGGGR